jgi:hypothetical protein
MDSNLELTRLFEPVELQRLRNLSEQTFVPVIPEARLELEKFRDFYVQQTLSEQQTTTLGREAVRKAMIMGGVTIGMTVAASEPYVAAGSMALYAGWRCIKFLKNDARQSIASRRASVVISFIENLDSRVVEASIEQ